MSAKQNISPRLECQSDVVVRICFVTHALGTTRVRATLPTTTTERLAVYVHVKNKEKATLGCNISRHDSNANPTCLTSRRYTNSADRVKHSQYTRTQIRTCTRLYISMYANVTKKISSPLPFPNPLPHFRYAHKKSLRS